MFTILNNGRKKEMEHIDLKNLNGQIMPRVNEIQNKMLNLQKRLGVVMNNFDFKEITENELEETDEK